MAENNASEIVNLYKPKYRFIIPINDFHVPKKLFRLFKKNIYTFKVNSNFENVIYNCQKINRKENGTWINNIILNTYINLHYYKMCHSVECYESNNLVGGLYGVHIGACFFGESMFGKLSNVSKFCLIYLIAILKKNLFCLLDSQFYNQHLLQFGAYEISSDSYMKKLKKNIMTEREFVFLDDFQEVLSLIQPNNIKS